MTLTKWQTKDIQDLLEEYPELVDMSDEELVIFSRKLYWEAQSLYDKVNYLENCAESVTLYMQTRGKQK